MVVSRRKYGLKPSHFREGCIDLLMDLFESSVQSHLQELSSSAKQQVTQHVVTNIDIQILKILHLYRPTR